VEIRLYGSLSATGVGHATDRATVMGLMGEWPDSIDPATIDRASSNCAKAASCFWRSERISFNWQHDLLLLDETCPTTPTPCR
jgi:L-serine dehydratase